MAIFVTTVGTTSAAWSTYYANPNHTSFTSDAGPELGFIFLQQLLKDNDDVGYPLVSDNHLYTIADDSFIGINAITGSHEIEIVNSYPFDKKITPTIQDDFVYLPQKIGSTIFLNKTNKATGEIDWSKEFTGNRIGGPTVADDKIVIGIRHSSSDKRLYCFDTDGNDLWTFDDLDSTYDFFAPVISNGKVICLSKSYGSSFGTHYLYCLDAETGDLLWTYSPGLIATSFNPVLDGEKLYVVFGDALVCTDINGDGSGGPQILWEQPFPTQPLQPAVSNSKIYTIAGKILYCIEGEDTPSILWSKELTEDSISVFPPSVANDKVFVAFQSASDAAVQCIDGIGNGDGTSNLIWQRQFEETTCKSPVSLVGNRAWITMYSQKAGGSYALGFTDELDTIPTIEGVSEGNVGQGYTYTFKADLPRGEGTFHYFIDWGDGTDSFWVPQYGAESGEELDLTHSWDSPGEYLVRVRIRESEFGLMSQWTILPVEIHRLEISSISGGLGVSATIRNVGDIGKDVEWKVEAIGGTVPGFHFKRSVNGSFKPLDQGTSQLVTTGPIFGLGKFKIMISAESAGEPIVEKTADALIVFFYVFIR